MSVMVLLSRSARPGWPRFREGLALNQGARLELSPRCCPLSRCPRCVVRPIAYQALAEAPSRSGARPMEKRRVDCLRVPRPGGLWELRLRPSLGGCNTATRNLAWIPPKVLAERGSSATGLVSPIPALTWAVTGVCPSGTSTGSRHLRHASWVVARRCLCRAWPKVVLGEKGANLVQGGICRDFVQKSASEQGEMKMSQFAGTFGRYTLLGALHAIPTGVVGIPGCSA